MEFLQTGPEYSRKLDLFGSTGAQPDEEQSSYDRQPE
jgi:hypothetical protein